MIRGTPERPARRVKQVQRGRKGRQERLARKAQKVIRATRLPIPTSRLSSLPRLKVKREIPEKPDRRGRKVNRG